MSLGLGVQLGIGGGNGMSVKLPFLNSLGGKCAGGVTFTRASSQWGTDDSGKLVQVGNNVPFFNSKGILLEPASTNKCTCYGTIPADSYGSTRTSGYALVKGVKYEIISRSTLDFTTVGAANNAAGTQFVATGGTLGTGDSVKDVLFGVGTKSYYDGSAWVANHLRINIPGNTTATITTVDDTAALAALGLVGKVYKLDNSVSATQADALIDGQTGNTNPHTVSVFIRGGSGRVFDGISGDGYRDFSASSSYVRQTVLTSPTATTRTLGIRADAGQILYFILPQLEELSFATSPMPCQGATATRAATLASFQTAGNILTVSMTGYMEWTPLMTGTTVRWLLGSYQDANNYCGILRDGAAGAIVFRKRISGVNYDTSYSLSVVVGATYKLSWRISAAGMDLFVNGVKAANQPNTTSAVYGATAQIGADGNSANIGRPQIRSLRISRRSLSDAQCLAMTT